MLGLYPRLSASSRSSDADADGNDDVFRYRAFYGIAVACVAILLFCVLAAAVGPWRAGAFAAAVASLLVVLGCFAPRTSCVHRRTGRPVSPVLALTARHLFHVECIDMWLDSHRTCPMCRCVISPPPTPMTAKASEPEEAPQSSDEVLPPV
ncbi:unnamed protein product [Triticum turgidum subsp. durum]|uniref:RING-type E3 ubiquitin transferase n=1 Tax=Triticum turgidum subsp. durum TaxID=4567 RepID=A0A9R0ZIR0_TRITD|nr:unnamed protein product [Triticum turgidum subsp. durum]